MQNSRVNVFSKLAISEDLGPTPCDWRVSKGGLTHLLFFLSSNISLEFYAKFEGQCFLGTGDVSRPGTNFHVIWRVPKGGLTHLFLFLSSNISLEFYAKFEGQRFLETGDVSRPGTNSM